MDKFKIQLAPAVTTGAPCPMSHERLLRLLRARQSHLFQRVTDRFLRRLTETCLREAIEAKDQQKLMKEGDDPYPSYLWFVYDGKVEVKDMNANVVLNTVKAGGVVGEYSVVTGKPRAADAFARDKAIVFKVSRDLILSLTPENQKFLEELAQEREALFEYQDELNPGREPVHPEVGLLATDMSLPSLEDFLRNKPSGVFADNIAAYKRLQRLGAKANIGVTPYFACFPHDAVFRSPQIEIDPSGLVAAKNRQTLPLLTLVPQEGHWASLFLHPRAQSHNMSYVEFLIELSNPVCELLFGVCDGSQDPANGQVTFRKDNAWMYYCHTGRKYTKGFGFDLSKQLVAGRPAGQGDRIGILVDQRQKQTSALKNNGEGRCAAVYVNGQLQGLLLSEKELNREGKQWPGQLYFAMDMHGENQRVALQPEKCRLLGIVNDTEGLDLMRQHRTGLPTTM